MDIMSEKISKLVFARNMNQQPGETMLTPQMLKTLTILDGKKNLGVVANELQISVSELRDIVNDLSQNGLIIKVEQQVIKLDKEFFLYMKGLLADSMGPIAATLIKDTVRKMGERFDSFPPDRAMEVVEKVSLKFFDDGQKQLFYTKMNEKLKSMRHS